MRPFALIAVGMLMVVAGLIWLFQGLGYVGGSFMTGATLWAVIGPVVALTGVALIAIALRGRRRAG